jgi:hypothetical protein
VDLLVDEEAVEDWHDVMTDIIAAQGYSWDSVGSLAGSLIDDFTESQSSDD